MTLSEMIREIPGFKSLTQDAQVSGLAYDSRRVSPGDAFFCLPGLHVDGHNYAQKALEAGAAALVVERPLPIDLPQVVVEDARLAMAGMSAAFYRHPSREMTIVGISGTKGKTTTTYLFKAAAQACGYKVGLLGSVAIMIGDDLIPADLNTPEAPDLQAILRRMADAGVQIAVMEVSAHGLAQHRVDGIVYDAVVMTNFTQDHLDYFHDMDTYAEAKKVFFAPERCRKASVNLDGDRALWFMENAPDVTTYAISKPSQIHANDIEIAQRGVTFSATVDGVAYPVALKLSGLFNVYNALAVLSVVHMLSLPIERAIAGINSVRAVPGRIEMLETNTPYGILLDYAHSPDSLDNILRTVKQFTKGRVIALFGCGGDRDAGKRPIMGEIAGRLADYVILTSDNPRTEDPFKIIAEIEGGIKRTGVAYETIESRREAIRRAMDIARPDDTIVLAGKGHETYQETGGVKRPFDEKRVVAELLAERAT